MKNLFVVMMCALTMVACGEDVAVEEPVGEENVVEPVVEQEPVVEGVDIEDTMPWVPDLTEECTGCDGVINHGARFLAAHRVESASRNRAQIMISDAPGRLSCRAVEDTNMLPGGSGTQVMMSLSVSDDVLDGCMEGEYILVGSILCHGMFDDEVPAHNPFLDGCASMRSWDNDGKTSKVRVARSGLVTLTDLGTECQATVELNFDGEDTLLGLYTFEKSEAATVCGEVPQG